jgi:ATP-binding cassette subfamily B protein
MSTRSVARKIFDFSLLRRVLKFASPYKRKFYISLALAIILAFFSPIRPILIQITVNDYIREGVNGNGPVKIRMEEMLIWITIIQIVLLLIESALRFYFSFLTAWLGQTVVKDLRVLVYEKILGLNLSQFDKTPIGTLTTRTINDIEAINDIFAEGLLPIIADLLSIICILFYMFYVDWRLTLICLAPFPVLIIATWILQGKCEQVIHQSKKCSGSPERFCTGTYHGNAGDTGVCCRRKRVWEIQNDQ